MSCSISRSILISVSVSDSVLKSVSGIRARLQKNECDEEKDEQEVLLLLILQLQLQLLPQYQIIFPLLLLLIQE